VLLICLCVAAGAHAQSDSIGEDSLQKARELNRRIYASPRKASIMSAIIPGLGQAYNKKYWKIPVIYGAFGGLAYVFISNNDKYNFYRTNHIAESDEDPETVNATILSGDQLQKEKLYYRKFRDLSAFGIGIVYIFNILDANVDAHLRTFDVSDDLGVSFRPYALPSAAGFQVTLKF
jgi:hypothetical protein